MQIQVETVFFAKSKDGKGDGSKSRTQKRSEREIWDEATKGLSEAMKRILHNKMQELKIGRRNLDPEEILAEREALYS